MLVTQLWLLGRVGLIICGGFAFVSVLWWCYYLFVSFLIPEVNESSSKRLYSGLCVDAFACLCSIVSSSLCHKLVCYL